MYLIPQLGDDATEPFGLDYIGRATYLAWTRDVASRGGLAVRLPAQAGQYQGVLGERYPAAVIAAQHFDTPIVWTTGKQFGYYGAPLKVRLLDKLHRADDAITIALGKAADDAEKASKSILFALLATVAVGAITYGAITRGGRSS